MTATNQILSWICRISKNILQSPILCSLKKNIMRKINHPGPVEDAEYQIEEKRFPTGPVYDDYESDPWENHEEEKERQEEQFISCPEPCVSNCVTEQVACYKFSGVFRLAYEL
jgi:hypothetical protein